MILGVESGSFLGVFGYDKYSIKVFALEGEQISSFLITWEATLSYLRQNSSSVLQIVND